MFPARLAGVLSCGDDDIRPELRRNARGEILSTPFGPLLFALPCPLPPGRYDYEVRFIRSAGPPGVALESPAPLENAESPLRGTLIVGSDEAHRGEVPHLSF